MKKAQVTTPEELAPQVANVETQQVDNVDFKVAKRGRPVGSGINPESKRQRKLVELAAKRENGELKRGRPVNPESKRQQRLTELESKRAAGELRRGRPKGSGKKVEKTTVEEVVVVVE
jgi:hypothetical protein